MASPESDKPALKSPPVKDSPIFGYVSSLSPIQPVNARPTSQLYENIDVPSPQLVFKTPSFIRPRSSSLLERSQHPSSPEYANNIREFSDIAEASRSLPATQSHTGEECTSGDTSPNQSCTSPSNCVDTFLADPSENGENSLSSPEFCVNRAAKSTDGNNTDRCENQLKCLKKDLLQHPHTSAMSISEKTDDNMENPTSMVSPCLPSNQDPCPPRTSQDKSISIEESPAVFHAADEEDGRLRVPYKMTGDQVNASMVSEVMESHKGSIAEQMEPVPKNVSLCTDTFNTADFTSHHEQYSLDQHLTDHSLVSRAWPCDIPICEKDFGTSDFICQNEQNLKAQAASSGQSNELDGTPPLHLDSPQNIQSCHNHADEVVQMLSASTGSQISLDQEDCPQHQRGNRKRLRFEAAENLRITSRNSFNCTTLASNVVSPITSLETGCVNSPLVKSITMSSYKQMIRSVPATVTCGLLNKADRSGLHKASPAIVPRPTGIGLHLNSIGNAAPMNYNSNMQPLEKSASVEEGKAFGVDNDQVPEKLRNCPISTSLIYPTNLSISSEKPLHYAANKNNEEKQQGNQVLQLQHSSGTHHSPLGVEPMKKSVPSKLIDRCMTPCSERIHSEEANISEESTQTSPRKKRKKASENDGHKRCNCKRSKCLKLYCDCFAAGSFCSEACACRDCSNRIEHEGTVLETRQQIESRNPLAFAPKVVLRVSDHPKTSGENKPITPTSARHKRGCNCKRSLCLKKYCECFQAGVGCSLGCRCEGCKNTFGMKDGCEISEMVVEHKRPEEGHFERDLSGVLENIEVKRQVSNAKKCHSRFSPLTPVVQTSMGNDMPKTQFPASYYPSPDSVASIVHAYEPLEGKSGSSSFVPYDTDSEYDNEGKGDPFSQGWESLQDLCNLSPFLKTSPDIAGSSCSSKMGDRKILQLKLFQESGRISLGSLCWRSSPMTPLPPFGESKFVREPDSDSQHCNAEDDTPEILKETRSPIKTIKATSPNQKRVSPPYLATGDTNTNSASGSRSGRKFILKSVPTFPPLTPYSKSSGEDGT